MEAALSRFGWRLIGIRQPSARQVAVTTDLGGIGQSLQLPFPPLGVMPGGIPERQGARRGKAVIHKCLLEGGH